MADALLSADHFYVNASYYNDTAVDQKARIVVQDTTNILDRSDDWLVHVTRFSVDSMKSLSYIEANLSAYWEIRLHNENGVSTNTYNFVLDRNYATPQDLIEAMNMGGATVSLSDTIYSAYRFELDAGGRFRLTGPLATNAYISYTGSDAMNTLLGFDYVTPTIRFTPSVTDQFSRLVGYLHEQALLLSTPANVFNGSYHSAINNILVHLLNGLKTYTSMAGSTAHVPVNPNHNIPFVLNEAGLALYDVSKRYLMFKGKTPTVFRREYEALVPQADIPVLIEYWDRPQGPQVQSDGFRSVIRRMKYGAPYGLGANQVATGHLLFRDLGNTVDLPPTSFPSYVPQSAGIYATYQYIYPYDSLPGYNISGYADAGAGADTVAIDVAQVVNGGTPGDWVYFENALPLCVQPGDDIWCPDVVHYKVPPSITLSEDHRRPFVVRQIMTIASDRMTATLDQGLGNKVFLDAIDTTVQPAVFLPFNIMLTNRRVPFQTRSRCHVGCLHHGWAETTAGISTVQLLDAGPVSVGDPFYWVVNGVMEPTQYTVLTATGPNLFTYEGALPASVAAATKQTQTEAATYTYVNDTTGIFVYKRDADVLRWARDAAALGMASTTFSYQVGPLGASGTATQARYPVVVYPGVQANGIQYPTRYQQAFDKTALGYQLRATRSIILEENLFLGATSTEGVGEIVESMTQDMLQTLPATSEIVNSSRGAWLDLGNQTLSGAADDLLEWFHSGNRWFIPNPWWSVKAYAGSGSHLSFIRENINDKPWLQMSHSETLTPLITWTQYALRMIGGTSTTGQVTSNEHNVSPLLVGLAPRIGGTVDNYVIWAPSFPIGTTGAPIANHHPINVFQLMQSLNPSYAPDASHIAVAFDQSSRGYNMARKELTGTALSSTRPSRLYGSDGDFIASTVASHVDLIFPFNQLILTSDDLQQVPEKTQDAGSRQPILSGYTLSTFVPTSVDRHGEPSGSTSTPFGTIYFSEGGQRRYHHLMRLSGPLRQFAINCAITYKDPSIDAREMLLHPGGQFTAQLLFIKKMEER